MKNNTHYTIRKFNDKTEWEAWTQAGILPADAPILMEEARWKTIDELLQEKLTGREKIVTEAMERAIAIRPAAEGLYRKISKEITHRTNIESIEQPWQIANLDGISANGWHIVEIKSGEYAFKKAREEGKIPRFYQAEAQHILSITGLKYITFFFYSEDDAKNESHLTYKAFRNEAYIARLNAVENAFMTRILAAKEKATRIEREAKEANPMKTTILEIMANIKHGIRVEYKTYKKFVPSFITTNGELTERGLQLAA